MIKLFLSAVLLVLSSSGMLLAQDQDYDMSENLKFRQRGYGLGAHIGGLGLGIDFQYYRYVHEDWEWTVAARFASVSHYLENKVDGIYKDQGGSAFIFDKMNYCYSGALLYGWQRNFIHLDAHNRLNIKLGLLLGPCIAVLKPYYVDVAVPVSPPTIPPKAEIVSLPYNETIIFSDIYGQGDFGNGMENLSGVPGMVFRTQATFNLGDSRVKIRGI